ncbi:hypothetical protein [Kushneria sinocarnis]|uniref:hypothetical protein n=1 Tax=Kushneria sinocarnis TaxID=595502 RepID=UPI001FE627B0|nr:hypothetical protein [Kushneria sinocarnis]
MALFWPSACCSGAIMLLGVSAMLGQWWLGVGEVLAMSVGTALTTSCLAALTVLMRERMQRIAGRSTPGWQSLLTHGLALCGGLLIMALGLALIALAGTAAPPPMMHGPL